MHDDSLYGEIRIRHNGSRPDEKETCHVIRKPVGRLTENEIRNDKVVDKTVRETIRAKFESYGSVYKQFEKAMKEPQNHPCLTFKYGKIVPIHRVRVFQSVTPQEIGNSSSRRLIVSNNNHHMEIFEGRDKNGKAEWIEKIVPFIEAMKRKREKLPIYSGTDSNGNQAIMTLAIGEAVEMNIGGERKVCVVQALSSRDYRFKPLNDARKAKDIKGSDDEIRIRSINGLRQAGLSKVYVSVDGRVQYANGRQDHRHQ